ncbi:VanZ family protein [Kineosporia sp. J2-2]|uniref:VanZ family protein n=1 Tax=Kineosporia corallincola TaxID=2835133 RepID=A0ABS5TTB0_9ACTN|nr:VanZ family protein [Kineosporia corallincola]MBT0774048.1 VanZ family protein [Kineosporia corallincola]
MSTRTTTTGPARLAPWPAVAFALAVVVHLVVLYLPRAPSTGGVPIDKPVHFAIFGAVLLTAAWAGLRVRPVALVLAGHAVVSELLQHFVLPNRSGDPADVVADLLGVIVAVGIVTRFPWRRA